MKLRRGKLSYVKMEGDETNTSRRKGGVWLVGRRGCSKLVVVVVVVVETVRKASIKEGSTVRMGEVNLPLNPMSIQVLLYLSPVPFGQVEKSLK